MNNSQPNSLGAIVDQHALLDKFIGNPLDAYESFTYNLEFFVVDRTADRMFQLQESFTVHDVANNKWPGADVNSITIAKTGSTTEFNITDLTIESVYKGTSTNSKLASTATKLNFMITQIGSTSLPDNLQNALALCGYESMFLATFYIKVNFVGYDARGRELTIPNSTKVFPFNLVDYMDLQTASDARGTATTLNGVIKQDEAISSSSLSKVESGFSYVVGATLEDTLANFFKKLNDTIIDKHKTLSENLQNTYSYKKSDQFAKYIKSSMKGDGTNTNQNMVKEVGGAEQIGQVTAGMNIFEVVQGICLNAVDVKEELIASKSGLTEVLKITPWLVIKENGYNPVKGSNVYDIYYYIDYELKEVIQNKLDDIDKAANSENVVQEWFDTGHVNKLYNYLFTGKNDQVVDFNISLEKQLFKTYSKPSDAYAYDHFLTQHTPEGKAISEAHKKLISELDSEVVELLKISQKSDLALLESKKSLTNLNKSIRNKIISWKHTSMGMPSAVLADEYYSELSVDEMLGQLAEDGETAGLTIDELANYDKLKKAVDDARFKGVFDGRNHQNKEKDRARMMSDAIATSLSTGNVGRREASKEIFNSLKLNGGKDSSQRKLLLVESLDDDIISTLSNSDFEIILRNQANNPISFQKLISKLSDPSKNYTIKSTNQESLTLAREKYYESNRYDLSMMKASMTIKGDPYWLEGVISPEKAKDLFGDRGSNDTILNLSTTQNGNNGCVIVSGASNGVDVNDNILTKNLITHLYMVTHVTSSFTSGRFLQTLQLIRNVKAEHMIDRPGTIGPVYEEIGDNIGNPNRPLPTSPYIVESNNGVNLLSDGTTEMREILINGSAILTAPGPPSELPSNPNFKGSLADQHGQGVLVTQEMLDAKKVLSEAEAVAKLVAAKEAARLSSMEAAMSEYLPRNAVSVAPDPTPVGDAKIKLAGELEANADMVVELHENTEPGKLELGGGPALRQAAAGMYLNSLPGMTRACKSEQARGVMPFVACDAITAHNKKILQIFETTPGVPPTTAEINAHLNNDIADAHPSDAGLVSDSASTIGYGVITDADGGSGSIVRDRGSITSVAGNNNEFSELEIAQFQIAHGAALSVDGHDPADIERLVRKYSLAKTPVAIVEEQKAGIVATDISSPDTGAIMNNAILEGNQTFIAKAAVETTINVPPTPPMTDAEYEAKYEAIRDDTSCVGQCRSAKIIMLGKEYNDAVKEQYYIDKANEKIINEAKSKDGWFTNAWNSTLKVIGFGADTYTESEHSDRVVLSEGINDILATTTLTSDQVAKKEALIRSSVVILDDKIKNDGLIISDVERSATVGAIITEISNEATLNAVSEVDYAKIKAYETAVKNIVVNASSGDRADLGVAVHVGKTQGEIAVLSAKHDAIIAKDYYFDPAHRAADALLQVQLENDLALLALTQPEEVTTKIATIETAGIDTYINIKNPVEVLAVNQTPLVVRNALSTYDIILPGTLSEKLAAVGGDMSMLSQYSEANKIYKLITKMDGAVMKVVTDDAGQKIKIKDFGAIGLITYRDANGVDQTIDPVTLFNLHTTTYEDMNPTYARDYNAIKKKIATLFPNIDTVDKNLTVKAGGLVNADGIPTSIMYDSFYVNP